MKELLNYTKFKKNKYFTWYVGIIENAIRENRIYDSNMFEKHHILPECLGGKDIVILTFREHYIAHLCLQRFSVGRDLMKMNFAVQTFFYFDNSRQMNLRQSSKLYSAHKKLFVEYLKFREPWVKKDIFHFKHKDNDDEFIGTRYDFIKYSGLTHQEVYNIIANNRIRHSKGWGVFIKDKNIFSFDLPIQKAKIKKTIRCEHCGISCISSNYYRWHGKNCKVIDPIGHVERSAGVTAIGKLNGVR